MDRRLFSLALLHFPLSSSVIIHVGQMLLGYLCLTFKLDALYLSLYIDYIKSISTFCTISCVKIVASGSDSTFCCLRSRLVFFQLLSPVCPVCIYHPLCVVWYTTPAASGQTFSWMNQHRLQTQVFWHNFLP